MVSPLLSLRTKVKFSVKVITPRAHARARGYVIGRGVYYILYIIYISARTFFYLSKYSLSDAHFSTGRLLFEFNRLQYTLAAPEVFVSSANPVILPSGYRVSIVRNTKILLFCRLGTGSASSETQTFTRSKPHPYCIAS